MKATVRENRGFNLLHRNQLYQETSSPGSYKHRYDKGRIFIVLAELYHCLPMILY